MMRLTLQTCPLYVHTSKYDTVLQCTYYLCERSAAAQRMPA
jgi:hypothetical protein